MGEKKRNFKLFDMNRDGKGVEKIDEGPRNFAFFFKLLGRKFNKLLSVNLMMLFLILPFIAAIFIYLLGPKINTILDVRYPVTYASAFMFQMPATDLLLTVTSYQLPVPMPNSYIYYVIGSLAFVYVLTFGWQNVGGTYLLRGLVRGDPVFVITDYFYAIKKNFRQGFIMGLIDALLIFVLIVDYFFFLDTPSGYFTDVMYVALIVLIFVYFIMRFYVYLQIVTFDLKLKQIIKNAFILTTLGIKRNIMALLGIVAVIIINFLLYVLLQPFNIIIPLILPLFYFLGLSGFIATYAAYPVIERYMIDMAEINDSKTHEQNVDSEISTDIGADEKLDGESDNEHSGEGDIHVEQDDAGHTKQ